MAQPITLEEFLSGVHPLYQRYYNDWNLAYRSYVGGVEYREGRYLRAYQTDIETTSETINTYDVDEGGYTSGKHRATTVNASSYADADKGGDYSGTFYGEKLSNTPMFPYVRLYCSEWNAMLFNSMPTRQLLDTPLMDKFLNNSDGEGNSINEFFSQLDLMTSIFGVMWVSCVKYTQSDYPLFKMHNPLDVVNWEYGYDGAGNLILRKLLIQLTEDENATVMRYFTPETIETIYMYKDEEDTDINIETDLDIIEGDGYVKTVTPNELGYIPCQPVYQGSKIYNGVGHTPTFDIAQIQRSIYGDFGELYSAVTYGSHPVNLVDENTSELNDGKVGAEPGTVLRVPSSVGGTPNYVYEFVAPEMQGVDQISKLIDQKIEKMNQVAMIRSDDLIKASRSGVQIEQYDSKLEAFVRRKAVALENAEYNIWTMWFDWMNMNMPEDFAVSYNRQYGKRALNYEIEEINNVLALYDQFNTRFGSKDLYKVEEYQTIAEAEARAVELGGTGYHEHTSDDGVVTYMPFANHLEYELAVDALNKELDVSSDDANIQEGLKKRIQQLLSGSYSENSL